MSDILLAKFTQNKGIGQLLIESRGKQLHEATTDRKWVVGTDLSSKALRSEDWSGNDVLGQLLESTREALIATLGNGSANGSAMPPQSARGKATQDDQCVPMSEDEASDSYEECIQSEDEIEQVKETSNGLSNDHTIFSA